MASLGVDIGIFLKGLQQIDVLARKLKSLATGVDDLAPAQARATRAADAHSRAIAGLGSTLTRLTPANKVVTQLGGNVAQLGAAAGLSAGAMVGLGAAVAGVGLALAAIKEGITGLVSLGQAGIEANAKIETLKIGIATVIASVAELRNSKGVKLEGADALQASLGLADEELRKLRIDALSTAATLEQIGPAFQQAIAPGIAAGLNLSQIRKITVDITQLASAIGQPLNQISQEVRAILSGDISIDARVANTLGLTRQMVEEAKKQNNLAELLNKKLAVAAASGKLVAQTFTAAKSNLAEAGSLFSEVVTKGLFDSLRDKLNAILPQVFDVKKANLLSDNFKGIGDTLTRIFALAGDKITRLIDFVFEGLKSVSKFLEENKAIVNDLIDAAFKFGEAIVGIPNAFRPLVGDANDAKDAIRNLTENLHNTALEIQFITELVNILFIGAIGGIKGIGLAVTTLVQKILGFIGISFDALDLEVRRLSNDIEDLKIDLSQSFDRLRSIQNAIQDAREAAKGIAVETPKTLADNLRGSVRAIRSAFGGVTVNPPPKPKPKPKAGRTVDTESARRQVADARLALEKALADREISLAKSTQQEQTRILEQELEDRKISLEQFYAAKQKLEEKTTAAEIAGVQLLIAAERERLADLNAAETRQLAAAKKNPAEQKKIATEADAKRLDIAAKTVELETRITELRAKGAADVAANSRARTVAVRALEAEIDQVNIELLAATGKGFESAALQIATSFKDLLARAILQFGADSGVVLAIKSLMAAKLTETELQAAALREGVLQTRLDTERLRIQNDLVRGVINERQARQEILALERARVAEIDRNLQLRQQRLIRLRGADDPEVADIERQREQLKQLGVDADSATLQIKRSLEANVESALEDIINHVGSLGDALKKLASQVIGVFAKLASQEITDFLFGRTPRNADAGTRASRLGGLFDQLLKRTPAKRADSTVTVDKGDAVSDAVGGVLNSVTDKFKGFTQSLGSIVNGLGGLLGRIASGIGSVVSSIFSGLGFAEGGFTGIGPTLAPAGLVHRREFVFDADTTSFFGVGFLEGLRDVASGRHRFNGGGFVGDIANIVEPRSGGSVSHSLTQKIVGVLGEDVMEEMYKSPHFTNQVLLTISKNPTVIKSHLKLPHR